jgi:perosamine synthetase
MRGVKVQIARPCLGEEERAAACEVLASGQLIQGEWVARFEERFARLHGARFGIATANGSLALTAALAAHGIGPGDEVIVPSFSFFATASSVVAVGATPVFADIEPETYGLCPTATEAAITNATRAILPVHLFGHLAQIDALRALCEQHDLPLIEDAAQAHLATDQGRHAGTWGTAAFSFHATKNMTTGEGGMVLTNDPQLAERLRRLRNQGRSGGPSHDTMGSNYRMSNLAAAIGLAQIDRLETLTEQRRANATRLRGGLEHVASPHERAGCRHVYQQYTVRVPPDVDRDTVLQHLAARGVGARVYYATPIHRQPAFEARETTKRAPLPVTERAAREVLSLPVHPLLSEAELDHVVTTTNAAVSAARR